MRKLLIGAVVVGTLLGQLSAFEAFKDGDKSLSVFGKANAVLGYGWNFVKNDWKGTYSAYTTNKQQNDIIFGIQGNSRIGLSFSVGKVFGVATLGAQESFSGISSGSGSNFRQLYAGYDFGEGGKLLAGKNELITSMGGFSSDIFNDESGLNGFGGTSTSTRRFQIAYSVAGLTVAISQNEFGTGASYKNWQKQIPRISLGYEYNSDSLMAKVAASYAHKNEYFLLSNGRNGHRDAVLLTAGVRPVFGDNYLSVLLIYGLNTDLIYETTSSETTLNRGYGNTTLGVDGFLAASSDTNTYALMIEFGHYITDNFAIKIGLGYQLVSNYDIAEKQYYKRHGYGGFIQLPYKVGEYFSIIPQVGYLGNIDKYPYSNPIYYNNFDSGIVLGEILFKFAF